MSKDFAEPIRGSARTPEAGYAEIERKAYNATINDIMDLCGVSDMDNRRVILSEALKHPLDRVREEIYRFASEMRQGEHKNARKPIAIFMNRLKNLPLAAR